MNKHERWYKLQTELKRIKKEEALLRREICEEFFKGRTGEFKEEKTFASYDMVATSKVNRTFDIAVYHSIKDSLTDYDKTAIKHTPSLVLAAYRKLPDSSLVHEIITEKPALPGLTLVVKS